MDDESIFLAALGKDSDEERRSFLAGACGGDSELRREVESLLRAHGKLADESAFLHPAPTANDMPEHLPIGTEIGPYRIRELLAEGGMGVVYVAEQTEPVRRKVALKIIKPGMATKDIVARFETERQALAMMDHPNIARVFDGGETAAGQPYFVMELVQGVPITEFCDAQSLPTQQRLRLFRDVCDAVQHAHRRGIIHRDLKPSNVLVAEIDGKPVAKVIDFGVAKAVSHKLTERTVYTRFSQMIGTPLYMSPEQAAMGVIDVDTRSDVYSLGVLLYELLTGETPFDRERLKQLGFDEMRRMIREEEPRRPSAMISTLNAEALSTRAKRRAADPRRLSRSLSGELDWITMKALEKDRNRRYESAGELAADVARFVNQEPVSAGPPSLAYRAKKYAQRHRGRLLAAASITVAVIIGLSTALASRLHNDRLRARVVASVQQSLAAARSAIDAGDLALAQQRVAEGRGRLAHADDEGLLQASEYPWPRSENAA